jgi:hypothetical protein
MKFTQAILIAIVCQSAIAVGLPASQQNIDLCAQNLLAQTTNTFAVAQACAGVQNPKLITDCVVTLRRDVNLAMPDAAVACAGVSDVQQLKTCLTTEKAAKFVDDEAVILCNQK